MPLNGRRVVLGTCICTRVAFEYKFEVLVLVLEAWVLGDICEEYILHLEH